LDRATAQHTHAVIEQQMLAGWSRRPVDVWHSY
jgi:hypothetical protein